MESRARVARQVSLGLLFLCCAALFSCAGAKTNVTAARSGPLPGLPGIPLDVPGHGSSDLHSAHIDGTGYARASTGVFPQGTNLLLPAGQSNPPALEWAIYTYNPDEAQDEVVSDIDLTFSVGSGVNGWIGIANYGRGQWEFAGPFTQAGGGPAKGFSNLDEGGYTSPAGNLFVLVAAYNGSSVTVNGLDVTSDITPAATFSISGRVIDNATSLGIPAVQVTLNPGNMTVGTNATGSYTFSGLAPDDYTITPAPVAGYEPFQPPSAFVTITTADEDMGNAFAADPEPVGVTYETGAGILKQKIDQYCIGCHNGQDPDQEGPNLTSWADLEFYDQFWPGGGSLEKLVALVTVLDPEENDYLMPNIGSDEADEIDDNNDRHWFSDWAANGFAQ
jgi:hypothetical protein